MVQNVEGRSNTSTVLIWDIGLWTDPQSARIDAVDNGKYKQTVQRGESCGEQQCLREGNTFYFDVAAGDIWGGPQALATTSDSKEKWQCTVLFEIPFDAQSHFVIQKDFG